MPRRSPVRLRTLAASFSTAALLLIAASAGACSAEPSALFAYDVPHDFAGKNGKAAKDLSGIACEPGEGVRHCLVINDEATFAQRATIDGQEFLAGNAVPLIGDSADGSILGHEPKVDTCPKGNGGFADLDGEAVAFASGRYYVAGSHGCARNTGEFRSSAFILAKVSAADDAAVVTTFRLAEVLRHAERVSAFFGKDIETANGLNIEGIAVQGDELIVGLRGPSIGQEAFLIRTDVAPLFAQGDASAALSSELIPVAVPEGAGIRDLAPLPDGGLLLLLGPAQSQALPYSIMRVDVPANVDRNTVLHGTSLAELPKVTQGNKTGKAEAITVLEATATELEVLVLFDSLKNGAPRKYRISLP